MAAPAPAQADALAPVGEPAGLDPGADAAPRLPGPRTAKRTRLTRVVASLATARVVGAATGLITGPLLARALGPAGRGDLAAIVVPLSLVPSILGLAIPAYAFRALPQGRSPGEVLGSLGLPLVAIGCVAAVFSVPIADALAGGRGTVRTFLIVGFLAMPLLMVANLVSASLTALERWRAVVATIVIPFGVPFLVIVVLYVGHGLTVATAAAGTIAGMLLSLTPGISLLRGGGRLRFRPALAWAGTVFGAKAWLGGLASLVNLRLDQFLMITAVAPRELGLYAVATTLSGAPLLAVGSLVPPLMARVSGGDRTLAPRGVRMALTCTLGLNLVLGLAAPVLISVLFGHRFQDAVPMAWILLGANIPYAGAMVLSSALLADGAPLIPTIAEAIALVVTVVGLLLLLGPLGGIGAALVSLAAYTISMVIQLIGAHRRMQVPLGRFIVPDRADLAWGWALVASTSRRLARQAA